MQGITTMTRKVGSAGTKTVSGRIVARSGLEAVNATERPICGKGAVRFAAVAEGLALAGGYAATLLDRRVTHALPGRGHATHGAWVHHEISLGTPGHGMAFELDARDAQEAVDHCLVAHLLTETLGRPGVCTITPAIADSLQVLGLPDQRILSEVLSDAPASSTEAFTLVSEKTGRPCRAVTAHAMTDAEYALVTTGGSSREASAAVDALRQAGIRCGAVGVTLVRPFPAAELRQALDGVRSVVVVERTNDPEYLTPKIREALGDRADVTLHAVAAGDDPSLSLVSAVIEELGLTSENGGTLELVADESPQAGQQIIVAAAPVGDWSDHLLLDVAGLAGNPGELTLEQRRSSCPRISVLAIGRGELDAGAGTEVDVLFVAHPSLLDAGVRMLQAVREGGTVVLNARADSIEQVAAAIGEQPRKQLAERQLRMRWIDLAQVTVDETQSPQENRNVLPGALVAADHTLAELIACNTGDLVGARALRPLEPAVLEAAGATQEADFSSSSQLPLMPQFAADESTDEWCDILRRFHMTGEGGYSTADPPVAMPLEPVSLVPLADPEQARQHFPLLLCADGAVKALATTITDALDTTQKDSGQLSILGRSRSRLLQVIARVLAHHDGRGLFGPLLDEALEALSGEFDLSEAAAKELAGEIETLKSHISVDGQLVGLNDRLLLRLYSEASRAGRTERIAAFTDDVRALVSRLEELLKLDNALTPEGSSAQVIAEPMGCGGDAIVDAGALAGYLSNKRGSKPLEAGRRQRIEETLATLQDYLEQAGSEPVFVLFHAGLVTDADDLPDVKIIEHAACLDAAVGMFEGLAGRMAEIIVAVRVARLEQDNGYDADRHDAMLARFDWQAFTKDEFLLMPPVVVIETGEKLRGELAASFTRLLRGGRPIHVLVVESNSETDACEMTESLASYHPGLGYVAVAHREPFVLQSTLAYPQHLMDGLKRMVSTLRPAVAVVASPVWDLPGSHWLNLAAAHAGRSTPCFRYDPGAGLTWADRFDLSENPQPEQPWPVSKISCVNDAGVEATHEEPLTFAHTEALDPLLRGQFRVIPTAAWGDEQIGISDYLALPDDKRAGLVPFIWVVKDDGVMARAVMTRELAMSCSDRARAWRILQELAGTGNEYARRAAEMARGQALAEAEEANAELLTVHTAEVEEARSEAAGKVMERLVNVLMNEDALSAFAGSAAPAAATPPAPVEEAAEPETAEAVEADVEEEEEAVSFNDPYIDSVLCTTCNECTDLNGLMFKYNSEKQAYVADASAGTFAELVKAASKCPARCIHPGQPRSDDETATDEMMAKAAPFN